VAEDIASRHGISLYYDADAHQFERKDQRNEADLSFLHGLAETKGVSVKVRDDRLILFSAKDADARPALLTFYRSNQPAGTEFAAANSVPAEEMKKYHTVSEYEFKRKSEGTSYTACVVDYHDPATNEMRSYTYNPSGKEMTAENTGKVLDMDNRVESEADAMALARNKLRGANKGECEGSFTVMGHPGLVAGMTVAMSGFGVFDGKYFVKKTTHAVGGKYTTKAEIRMVLGY
jgi:phage protein D